MSELRYSWEWSLGASPEALWPLVSDTNRFNLETGVPPVELVEADGAGARLLRLRAVGRTIEFEEQPFEWVRPERFGVVRRYREGPIAELEARLALSRAGTGTTLVYEVRVVPRGLFGRAVVPVLVGRLARRRMEEAFLRYDVLARAGGEASEPGRRSGGSRLAPGEAERLQAHRRALAEAGAEQELVRRLVDEIAHADGLSLARLRPYALADVWGSERRQTLELFLHATRLGLLESRWELLCPLCRGAAQTVSSLGELAGHARCDSCGIDAAADLDRTVELVFRPHAAVREVEEVAFCLAGPGVTPHVVVQQRLAPGERRRLEVALEPGAYRVREHGGTLIGSLFVEPGEEATEVELANDAEEERVVVVERTVWSDQAATAAEVTALQAFRDLFATEALRPGVELGVGSLTVVFTDLRGSTSLYREIGDATAFGSVADHFDVLRDEIAREGGAFVKTIGDAVLAVFRRPAGAVRAALEAQRRLAGGEAGRPLALKVGLHAGPCLAVTLNGRLDYFGSTVNAAARIVELSAGDDLVCSDAIHDDPEVLVLLANEAFRLEPVQARLRGLDDEPLRLWRIGRP